MTAHVTVKNKIAVGDGTVFVGGNSDYVVEFAFDEEWDAYDTKTARFITQQGYRDVIFTGNMCEVPILSGTKYVHIGVFAGDLRTTTAAKFTVRLSISCENGPPANPSDDVYNQLMEKLNGLSTGNGTESGEDGVSVTNAEINQNGNLILTLSDGNIIDAGVAKGEDGSTPIRGVDYWTEEDINEIKNYIDTSILNGSW